MDKRDRLFRSATGNADEHTESCDPVREVPFPSPIDLGLYWRYPQFLKEGEIFALSSPQDTLNSTLGELCSGEEYALAHETLGVQFPVRDSYLPHNALYQPGEHHCRRWPLMRSEGSRGGLRESWSQAHQGAALESASPSGARGLCRGLRSLLFRAEVTYVVCNPQGICRWV